MNYEIVISIAALLDIEQAVDWYEKRSNGLGDRLKSNLYESLSIVEENPQLSSKKYMEIRVRYLKSFPYGIHYLIEGDKVKVFGFFHMKRNPTKWLERL